MRRVRELSAWELTAELDDAIVDLLLDKPSDGPLTPAERRMLRVMRELARRDYRDREHGRKCACQECMYLWEVWIHLQRRRDA